MSISTTDIRINLNLIPERQQKRLSGLFFEAMSEFFSDPDNEAEFQQWKRERGSVQTK